MNDWKVMWLATNVWLAAALVTDYWFSKVMCGLVGLCCGVLMVLVKIKDETTEN